QTLLESIHSATRDPDLKLRLGLILAHCPKRRFPANKVCAPVKGIALFKGEIPKRSVLDVSGDKKVAAFYAGKPPPLSQVLVVGEKRELANVVIYISK